MTHLPERGASAPCHGCDQTIVWVAGPPDSGFRGAWLHPHPADDLHHDPRPATGWPPPGPIAGTPGEPHPATPKVDWMQVAANLLGQVQQLTYERQLLGACRLHLDQIADPEGRYTADAVRGAADLAQRIVDEIGLPVTDEPVLGPSFREQLADLEVQIRRDAPLIEAAVAVVKAIRSLRSLSPEARALITAADLRESGSASSDVHPQMVTSPPEIAYALVTRRGGLWGIHLDGDYSHRMAREVGLVVLEIPVAADYREVKP